MQFSEAYHYLIQGERRKQILLQIKQPVTIKQLSKLTSFREDACSYIIWELRIYELVYCLNDQARRSRLYWLTDLGKTCQRKLLAENDLPFLDHNFPNVDWNLYGWVCYSHRSTIIKVLTKPLQPSEIKRKAKFLYPSITMSANNVRDVIKLFLEKGIVTRIYFPGKAHPRYELTHLGKDLQRLLLFSEHPA